MILSPGSLVLISLDGINYGSIFSSVLAFFRKEKDVVKKIPSIAMKTPLLHGCFLII
jgi:hypothetical protein